MRLWMMSQWHWTYRLSEFSQSLFSHVCFPMFSLWNIGVHGVPRSTQRVHFNFHGQHSWFREYPSFVGSGPWKSCIGSMGSRPYEVNMTCTILETSIIYLYYIYIHLSIYIYISIYILCYIYNIYIYISGLIWCDCSCLAQLYLSVILHYPS